MLNVLVNKTLE